MLGLRLGLGVREKLRVRVRVRENARKILPIEIHEIENRAW